ncbi:hypothetical protein LSH36_339g05007 [Paralvinella palmiformis]|uniref:Uncharacterized protein n=1 Tax=Paralvinella palmiformis TaxID=53620 RepID=A0AAD9JFD9_9ANNE|nr:hypothetical protein LSH36_339g05007 [Paralvinella palmiformis]
MKNAAVGYNRKAKAAGETGMSLLLLRSGLVLTPLSVRQQCLTSLRLAVLVNCLDMVTMTVLSKYMLAIPWLWSVLLGFLTATVGPTVVNPCAFAFQSRGYGINKAIASLLVVASSVDNIIPVTGFAVLLVLLGDEGHLVLNIFRGPLEAMGGVLVAMVTGLILWYIPHPLHPSRTLLRVLLLLSCGCLFSLGSWALGLTSATPIGTITLMFVVIPRWRRERSLREKMKKQSMVVLAAQTLNHDKDPEELGELIKLVTTVGYLIVLISLPLGSALTMLTGSCLLSRSSHLLSTDPSEKTDLVWTNHNGYKPEVSRMKISDISTHTTEIEVTTERETVT